MAARLFLTRNTAVMMARYLLFGHLTIDDTVLPDGRTAMGTVGGNVLYAAIGARVWTDDLAIIARPGQGYPANLIEELAACGYRVDGLIPCKGRRIRQWQLYDDEGGRHYVPLASSGSYIELAPRVEDIPFSVTDGATGCHIAPLPVEYQVPLVHWARERRLRVMVDPHHESVNGTAHLWQRMLPAVDVFSPSREEATGLLGGWDGPEAAARLLADWGAAVVCLKLGADGVFVYRAADQASWCVPSLVERPVDVTGCGDAFCGGFLVGWCETGDLHTAARYGSVSASFVAEDFGGRHALRVDRGAAWRRLAMLP
ncbi:MAG TPA: carbohydrate kinase family protein [Ktedonobacteraceae bacterium]|nr:carbohydrate kinase family protein [Ktedonobacteraceae bacterium]